MAYTVQRLKALAAYSLLKVNARAVWGEEDAPSKLGVLAQAAALASLSEADLLSVHVSAEFLISQAETGRYFQLLSREDLASLTESRAFSMSALRKDEIAAVEKALRTLRKSFSDAASLSDTARTALGKQRTDTTSTADQQHYQANKALLSQLATLDVKRSATSKARSDEVTAQERADWSLIKTAADGLFNADALSRVVVYARHFQDIADATDEINATLLTDDGQVMVLQKGLRDTAVSLDKAFLGQAKVLADSGQMSEQALHLVRKLAVDQVVFGDTAPVTVSKVSVDTVSSSLQWAFSLNATRQSQAITQDRAPVVFNKSLQDWVMTSEVMRFDTRLNKQDGAVALDEADVIRIAAAGVPAQYELQQIGDDYASTYYKNLSEALSTTEDFLGAAFLDDDQTLTFRKFTPENLFATERIAASLQRPHAETLEASSSGLLFWTNYSDSTYFAQGYVGQERNFT
jgi:hypothetical protein